MWSLKKMFEFFELQTIQTYRFNMEKDKFDEK